MNPGGAHVRLLAAALMASCVAACGTTTAPRPRPSRSVQGTPSAAQLKPVLRGLLDRGGVPPPAFLGMFAGYVVNARWKDLQPSAGQPLAADNAIDQAIATVRSINAFQRTELGLKLRLFAGIHAPDWAKHLGGDPVAVSDPHSGASGTVGRFWTDAFGHAYDVLQSMLAAKYDGIPEVREVTISRCTTVYAEPFIRNVGDQATVQALLAAGYSVQADERCQHEQVDAASVWRRTHSDLSFNPYQVIKPDGSTSSDEGFTESMMDYCRQRLGRACVLENNSLRDPPLSAYQAMYEKMRSLGQPIAFQTAAEKRVGNLESTLSNAIGLGANSVELPGGYQALAMSTTFSSLAHALSANPAG